MNKIDKNVLRERIYKIKLFKIKNRPVINYKNGLS